MSVDQSWHVQTLVVSWQSSARYAGACRRKYWWLLWLLGLRSTVTVDPLQYAFRQSLAHNGRFSPKQYSANQRVDSVVHDVAVLCWIQFALVRATSPHHVGRLSRDRQRRLGVRWIQHVARPHERHKVSTVRMTRVLHVTVLSCVNKFIPVWNTEVIDSRFSPVRNRACQLYNNISMLFLFPVIDGKISTGVNATFNA